MAFVYLPSSSPPLPRLPKNAYLKSGSSYPSFLSGAFSIFFFSIFVSFFPVINFIYLKNVISKKIMGLWGSKTNPKERVAY